MSNKINTITVVLEKETSEDACEQIINAIQMVRGVLSVSPHIANHTEYMAQERARYDLGKKIWEIIYPK